MSDRWHGFVLVRDLEGMTMSEVIRSVLMTECPHCWALVLEARYPRHLASHESKESREGNAP
jgi:hypothetical protein